jgi:hypothetical protein
MYPPLPDSGQTGVAGARRREKGSSWICRCTCGHRLIRELTIRSCAKLPDEPSTSTYPIPGHGAHVLLILHTFHGSFLEHYRVPLMWHLDHLVFPSFGSRLYATGWIAEFQEKRKRNFPGCNISLPPAVDKSSANRATSSGHECRAYQNSESPALPLPVRDECR